MLSLASGSQLAFLISLLLSKDSITSPEQRLVDVLQGFEE